MYLTADVIYFGSYLIALSSLNLEVYFEDLKYHYCEIISVDIRKIHLLTNTEPQSSLNFVLFLEMFKGLKLVKRK